MTRQRMVELLEIEKECVRRNACGECNRACHICDLLQDDTELHEMYEEVIALVKAQKPRVMTLEESSAINCGDIVWIEDRSLNQMIVGIKYQSPSENCYYVILIGSKRPQPFSKELYRVNWRCWTSRPTDEQRAAEPWDC